MTTRVAVIGGGVVGLSCAYFLARRGAAVTVFEAGRLGGGASHGNAGLISPSLSAPIPGPGALAHALKSLRRRDVTISLRPTASPARLLWLAGFALHCTRRRHERGLHATARLTALAIDAYDELARDGVPMRIADAPVLLAFADPGAAERCSLELAPMQRYGYPRLAPCDGDEARALEPALSAHVQAAIAVPGERFVDPATVISGLAKRLRALGADLREHSTVTAIGPGPSVEAGGRPEYVDAVVIAAGADSRRVARLAGIRLPVEGGKGHSVVLAADPLPRAPVGLLEPKVACTPMGGRLRLTGGMELGGARPGVDRAVIDGIVRAAAPFFAGLDAASATEAWAGMRPMTPSGLPVIGPARHGIYVATGHSTLGVTLGPITGRLVAEQLLDGRADPALAPFAP